MRQQTCKPFARQNKNKQNGFGICYHFAIKREMRFSKSERFQGFSAPHVHFFLIPTLRMKFVAPRLTLYNPRFVTYITSNTDFLHGSRGFFHTKVMPVAGRRKAQMPR